MREEKDPRGTREETEIRDQRGMRGGTREVRREEVREREEEPENDWHDQSILNNIIELVSLECWFMVIGMLCTILDIQTDLLFMM